MRNAMVSLTAIMAVACLGAEDAKHVGNAKRARQPEVIQRPLGKDWQLPVSIDGLTFVDGDKRVHFDRESYIELGKRYCEAYEKLVRGKQQGGQEE